MPMTKSYYLKHWRDVTVVGKTGLFETRRSKVLLGNI